eukprot:4170568-Prymnesium_polylepis.1
MKAILETRPDLVLVYGEQPYSVRLAQPAEATDTTFEDFMLAHNLKPYDSEDVEYAHAIREAFRAADEADEQSFSEWPRELTFYHGTSWSGAQAIQRHGFER